jgi:serine/threonine protein kinase
LRPAAQRTLDDTILHSAAHRAVDNTVLRPAAQRTLDDTVLHPAAHRTVDDTVLRSAAQRKADDTLLRAAAQRSADDTILRPAAQRSAPATPPPTPVRADATPRVLAAGDVLRGRYLVQGQLGQGGMGTVYAAIDQFRLDQSDSDQKVAIKVLHTEVIKRPRLFAELRREFQHLQSLSHPNIVRVHEFDRDGDLAFFTMEYLSGAQLSRILAARESAAIERPYALTIIRDVGAAVAHAHAKGVVHGDLNPANIFITDAGEVRVLDFGASYQLHRGPWISEFGSQQQLAVATPGYASCQVLEGEAADARDDVYALSCIAYVLLSGERPFQDNSALKARTLGLAPKRPRGLNRRQWNALRAGLSFDRDRRPRDPQAWLERLELQGAAPRLPELQSLWTARPQRQSSTKWLAPTVLAAIAAGGWWAVENIDSINWAGAAAGANIKSMVGKIFTSSLWEKDFAIGGHREPVIEAPKDDAQQEEPSAAAPSVQPRPEPSAARSFSDAAPGTPAAGSPATPSAVPTAKTAAPPPAIPIAAAPPKPSVASPTMARADSPAASSARVAALGNVGAAAAQGAAAGSNFGSPRARLELASDAVEVMPGEPTAHFVVRRSRNLKGDASFIWWTESGTAKAGRDFEAVKAHVERVDSGQSAVSLMVPVLVDPTRREPRSFYVVIDQPSDNATLGSRTLTMVTIP